MPSRLFAAVLAALGLLLPSRPAADPIAHPPGYVATRAPGPVTVDGRLDEAAWHDAAWTADFVDIEGGAKPKPALRTRMKMIWDDAYLYMGVDIDEPNLWSTMKDHDSPLYQENAFEFFIDPDGDNHDYYEFEINPFNTTWDLLLNRPYKDQGKGVSDWEILGLKSAVHLDGTLNDASDVDRGWSIEIAIPWKALAELAHKPAPPRDGDQWRMNFTRVETALTKEGKAYRKVAGEASKVSSWAPQYLNDIHRPETWGYVQFAHAAVPFVPDPSWPARRWLHAVYYAERTYRQAHGRWAGTLEELGIAAPDDATLANPKLATTPSLFEVSIDVTPASGRPQHWHIRQDSLIWPDES